MAVSRGSGTEIIRSISVLGVDSSSRVLIYGVQHHIYTVLSIEVHALTIQAAGNWVQGFIQGYDSVGGTSDSTMIIFKNDMSLTQTFVFNDRFSFNGNEPTNFTGPMDSIVKQDAIADQGSSVAQLLKVSTQHADDAFNVFCTFIDQNNA
tara:strand:- start:37 stop:486 length:450 start_codon:yes stop_codon:yes gene_type:complete